MMRRSSGTLGISLPLGTALLLLCGAVACGGSDSEAGGSGGHAGGGGGGKGGAGGGLAIGGATGGGAATGSGGAPGPYQLPPGFTKTELGGFKLGEAFNGDTPPNVGSGGTAGSSDTCGTTILAVVRDFKAAGEPGGHPDFEAFSGFGTTGMMPDDLGADLKPGYTGICEEDQSTSSECPDGQQSTTKSSFDQWYRYAAGVNKPYVVYLSLEPNGNVITFQSDFFFPLDGAGWGNSGTGLDGKQHNFHFTTEVHTQFKYAGGESLTFIGDDDVWVFINDKLAVDLGGLHPPLSGTIDLDSKSAELGIKPGNSYSFDLFHAERHTEASNFRIDTNFAFTNCGTIVPEPPVK